MRDCSLGAAPPLRTSFRILLHLRAFFGLCVCWTPISAHSITELPAPMSLSPFPVDLRIWTLRNSRWIANRDVRLRRYLRLFPRSQPGFGVPCPRAVPQCGHFRIDQDCSSVLRQGRIMEQLGHGGRATAEPPTLSRDSPVLCCPNYEDLHAGLRARYICIE